MGMISSSLIIHVLAKFVKVTIRQNATRDFILGRILPIGLVSSTTIVLGNIVYLHLSVAFIQILKALTPVYILLTMFAFRLDSPSVRLVGSVSVISLGTSVASTGEVNFSLLGFVLQSFADMTEGLKLVLQDVLLKKEKMSPMESLYFVAPASAVCQACYILVMEADGLRPETTGRLLRNHWPVVAVVSIGGFFVNILGFFVMQRTNALFLKLLSILRSNGLVVVSFVFIPGNQVTPLEWFGYALSMVGFLCYVMLKQGPSRPMFPGRAVKV